MSERIVLIRNMGNSGGAWLMEVFNRQKDILIFQELNQVLRLKYDLTGKAKRNMYPNVDYDVKIAQRSPDLKGFLFNSRTQCEIAIRFLLYQYDIRPERVIGLIKCFDNEAIKTCEGRCNSVKVIQVLRNPVGIINFYMSQDNLRQIAHHDPYEVCFKKHIDFFSSRFLEYLENKRERGEEIIRLEDINISLKYKTPFFKRLIKELFEIECPDDFIEEIKRDLGYGDEGDQNEKIWGSWEGWKKRYFKECFGGIMANLGYELRGN